MVCPNCKYNSISFLRVWIAGEFGRFTCPKCSAPCRIRRSMLQCAVSGCLGCIAVFLGLSFSSWTIFGLALGVVLALDALKDYKFRQLEVVEKTPDKKIT